MACAIHPASDGAALSRTVSPDAPPMTGCACAGVSFEEIKQAIRADGVSFKELSRRTGCGGNCTACIPDLKRFLASF